MTGGGGGHLGEQAMCLQCPPCPRAPFMPLFGARGCCAEEERTALLHKMRAGLPSPLRAWYTAFGGPLRAFLFGCSFHLLENEEQPVTAELLPACFLDLSSE